MCPSQVYINPTNRLSLIGECSVFDGSDCTEPMTYEWQVSVYMYQLTLNSY